MSWEPWQIVTFTFIFLFSVVFISSQIIFLGSTETSFSFRLMFSPNRKRNVYQSWETSCQSDRPCAPGNEPPPPIRTTALLLRTIPSLSSRHQDTPSLPPTTTPSLPPSPTPPPSTSPTARSTATTATPADCSSSTSEPGGTGMKCKRGHGELKEGKKQATMIRGPQFSPSPPSRRPCLFLLFPTLAVIHGRLYTGGLRIWFWLHHLMCHHIWKPHMLWTISLFKWVTLSWFWIGKLWTNDDMLKTSIHKHHSHYSLKILIFRTLWIL